MLISILIGGKGTIRGKRQAKARVDFTKIRGTRQAKARVVDFTKIRGTRQAKARVVDFTKIRGIRQARVDFTNSLPDDCLELIFTCIASTNDRNNASLVSHRWLRMDAQTRTHLTVKALSDLQLSIFTRFNSLTHLVLDNLFNSYFSINDNDIILITSICPRLTRLHLRYCNKLTDFGIAVFSKNCTRLKEFSCDKCDKLTDLGMVQFLNNSSQLEVLSLTWLFSGVGPLPYFHAAKSLKVIVFKLVLTDRFVIPLIIGSKNLKTLEVCGGSWDRCMEMIPDDNRLVEVNLRCINMTDAGFLSLSKCRYLIALYIESPRCTDIGLISVAENCKGLKTLSVGSMSEIGDQGLIAFGKHSLNLEELGLDLVMASCVSLEAIATNCQKLIRISLSRCLRITDLEMSCIAKNCVALKFLHIYSCAVSNKGIEALALGCPNLVSLSVTMCRNVSREAEDLLREKRGSLVVEYSPY